MFLYFLVLLLWDIYYKIYRWTKICWILLLSLIHPPVIYTDMHSCGYIIKPQNFSLRKKSLVGKDNPSEVCPPHCRIMRFLIVSTIHLEPYTSTSERVIDANATSAVFFRIKVNWAYSDSRVRHLIPNFRWSMKSLRLDSKLFAYSTK